MTIYSEWLGSKSGTWQGDSDFIVATETSFDSVGWSFYDGNRIYGDVSDTLSGSAAGGDDTLTGAAGAHFNEIQGDALWLQDQAVGGDDWLVAGSNVVVLQELSGDAFQMTGSARGGDDVLVGMPAPSGSGVYTGTWLIGDASMMRDSTVCGNDTLIGGVTTGRDVFVFGPANGMDTIFDFERGKDLIDLSALGLPERALQQAAHPIPIDRLPAKALDALSRHVLTAFGLLDSDRDRVLDEGDAFVSISADGDTVIDLGAATGGASGIHTVTLVGVIGLTAKDFVF